MRLVVAKLLMAVLMLYGMSAALWIVLYGIPGLASGRTPMSEMVFHVAFFAAAMVLGWLLWRTIEKRDS